MTANTPLGLPYPETTDRVADGWDAIRDLAEAVDDKLTAIGVAAAAAAAADDTRLDALEADTGWIAPAFNSGWSHYGAGYLSAGYRRLRGVVYLRGMIKRGSVDSLIPFVLPAGFRPSAASIVTAVGRSFRSSGGSGDPDIENIGVRLNIHANGEVSCQYEAINGTVIPYLSLSGISFIPD